MSDIIRAIGATAGARGLLSFAGVHLVLTAGDLRMIEASADLVRDDPPAGGVGWIEALGQWWPVYSLTFDLVPSVDEEAATRRMCAVLGDGRGLFGLLCDDIQIMRGAGPMFGPLPVCMRSAGLPIQSLAADARGLLCGTDADALGRVIGVATSLDRQQVA